jgi:hypothetical protein
MTGGLDDGGLCVDGFVYFPAVVDPLVNLQLLVI